MSALWLLWALTGGGLSIAIMIRLWLPDPPPDIMGRFVTVLVAGLIGGAVGGFLTGAVGNEPVTGIIGAAAGGLILSGAAGILGAAGRGNVAR
jgi:hypothetical protein